MKIYKNLVNAAAETLQEIFEQNRYADKAIEKKFKSHPQWGSRDRRFVAEAVYDIVRYKRLYSALVRSEKNYWFMVAAWVILKEYDLPDWPEFYNLKRENIKADFKALKSEPVVAESYPDWLWEFGYKELGEMVWEKEAKALNEPAKLVFRANTLKAPTSELEKKLQALSVPFEKLPQSKEAYVFPKKENVFKNPLFKEGYFEIQDAGSQQIASFLNPGTNDLVIDACAGAGGKSLHLAALMKNKGRVVSLDVEAWKLEELKKRAKRAGAFNIETRLIENEKSLSPFLAKADKLLLDVPCSGSGVLKRNPDAKWKLSEESIARTKALQQKILNDYSAMLKPGGELVYSTCSIFPSENREQVDFFLNHHPEFEYKEEKTLLPSEGFDGFYMARLLKKC
ncbi:MAG: RsmB/NOP family class I SAM-dependent RNA methyltransferase [Bacteroidia bacterium]|jgi:16S rRNA (cytosine967-C5)-methyltransferase|nr:RsmB/NOP family class I SAM-dependent RNA methyltransferase [Bacteroidia bacterium]